MSRRPVDLLALAIFAALSYSVTQGYTLSYDQSISEWVEGWGRPQLDYFMLAITHCGDMLTLAAVSVALSAFLFWGMRRKRAALAMLITVSLGYGIDNALKMTFARPRPQLSPLFVDPSSYSFPSGHAMNSMAVYGCAAFLLSQALPRRRWLFRATAAGLVVLIGTSRVYLDAHWPSDVLAGFAAGWILLSVVRSWYLHDSTRPEIDIPQNKQPGEHVD